MKDILKRCAVLFTALAMVFSMCGCGSSTRVKVTDPKVNRAAQETVCGTFQITGSLGTSGTVTLTGKLPRLKGANYTYYQSVSNQKYTYKRSGNTVTFTRKGGTTYDGPKTVRGTYNSRTNTFTVNNANYCV